MKKYKRMFKKSPEELEEYLKIMKRHNVVKNKKGKGSYVRKKKNKREEDADLYQVFNRIFCI